jgi:hypothetical protein
MEPEKKNEAKPEEQKEVDELNATLSKGPPAAATT